MSSTEKNINESMFGGERVLVVPDYVLSDLLGQGKDFYAVSHDSLEEIKPAVSFIDRFSAEKDESHRQLIPYVIIRNSSDAVRYFLFKRLSTQGEKRLHNLYSLGAGGHINPIDENSDDILAAGLMRELSEELFIPIEYDLTFRGWIYSGIDNVSRVHAGMVFVMEIRDNDIKIRETDKMTGSWYTIEELGEFESGMEGWAKIVYEHLILPEGDFENAV